jgi:hypothetical protein
LDLVYPDAFAAMMEHVPVKVDMRPMVYPCPSIESTNGVDIGILRSYVGKGTLAAVQEGKHLIITATMWPQLSQGGGILEILAKRTAIQNVTIKLPSTITFMKDTITLSGLEDGTLDKLRRVYGTDDDVRKTFALLRTISFIAQKLTIFGAVYVNGVRVEEKDHLLLKCSIPCSVSTFMEKPEELPAAVLLLPWIDGIIEWRGY